MFDLLNKWLAELLSKFKASNPIVFTVIAAVLTVVKALIDNGTIPIDPKVAEWILWAIALFIGTPTTKFLLSTNKQN